MTSNSGNLSYYFNLSNHGKIIVGNGSEIPIIGLGTKRLNPPPLPPLVLKNVLHAPHLIKNLVSVRKFTTANNVSVEFDRFGFTVKDMQTEMPLMRRNSSGDLYPLLPSTNTDSSTTKALTTISASTWHNRLGHPGPTMISLLRNNNFISCNSVSKHFCHSCQLGKHNKLPFSLSNNNTLYPFDIIHSDLWTSPVVSSMGHRFYVLFLNDFSNFLWTFPIKHKSDVFNIFTTFHTFLQTQFHRPIKISNVIMAANMTTPISTIISKLTA